jgi:hypothetical protein
MVCEPPVPTQEEITARADLLVDCQHLLLLMLLLLFSDLRGGHSVRLRLQLLGSRLIHDTLTLSALLAG